MYLFFDTETNGLPRNMAGNIRDLDNWPRVIQLAYILLDENMNEVETFCELIKPDGWIIPNEKFWIENGYSTEQNNEKGVYAAFALQHFANAIDRCHTMVAHNISFDTPVLSAEMIRYEIRALNKPQNRRCTMKESTQYVGAVNARGGIKWPKLTELHEKLFGVGFEGAHDALEDVRATVRCFIELKRLAVIH